MKYRRLSAGLLSTLFIGFVIAGCEAKDIPLVDQENGEAADFGRSELLEAMAAFAISSKDPKAYRTFAERVEELRVQFNRDVQREAELRLSVLAIGPLRDALVESPEVQMELLGTTVWPTILGVPTSDGETTDDYVKRLCRTELAFTCHNVIPEKWPALLNAQVWRRLKNRVQLAYDRCRYCDDDPTFIPLIGSARDAQIQAELAAKDAVKEGRPQAWPRAGEHSTALSASPILSFAALGHVTVDGAAAVGGNWRGAIAALQREGSPVGIHLAPERLVTDLLEILEDVNRAGYRQAAIVVRHPEFPYDAKQYVVASKTRRAATWNVRDSDSIQILIQSLDLRNSNRSGG